MRGSISRKGNRRDNAAAETLFCSLNVERLYGMRRETRRADMDEVADRFLFHNLKRLHLTLEHNSLTTFEEIWRRQQNTLAVQSLALREALRGGRGRSSACRVRIIICRLHRSRSQTVSERIAGL